MGEEGTLGELTLISSQASLVIVNLGAADATKDRVQRVEIALWNRQAEGVVRDRLGERLDVVVTDEHGYGSPVDGLEEPVGPPPVTGGRKGEEAVARDELVLVIDRVVRPQRFSQVIVERSRDQR